MLLQCSRKDLLFEDILISFSQWQKSTASDSHVQIIDTKWQEKSDLINNSVFCLRTDAEEKYEFFFWNILDENYTSLAKPFTGVFENESMTEKI